MLGVRGRMRPRWISSLAVLAAVGAASVTGVHALPEAGAAPGPVAAVSSDGRMFPLGGPGSGPVGVSASSGSVPPAPKHVVGTDDRVRVNPTTTYPASATVLIRMSAGDCSGWMISRNTVATAGHCVSPGNGSFYGGFTVYPARNGSTSPYGSCGVKTMWTNTEWLRNKNWFYDYGALRLNCNIGDRTGWYGFFWTSSSLNNSVATTQGYPGDKTYGTQWMASGTVTENGSSRFRTRIDIFGGQSGSAYYKYYSSTCSVCALAIASTEHHVGSDYWNEATRITKPVFDFLVGVKNSP